MARPSSERDGSSAASTVTEKAPTRLCPTRSADETTSRLSGSCCSKSLRVRATRRLTTAAGEQRGGERREQAPRGRDEDCHHDPEHEADRERAEDDAAEVRLDPGDLGLGRDQRRPRPASSCEEAGPAPRSAPGRRAPRRERRRSSARAPGSCCGAAARARRRRPRRRRRRGRGGRRRRAAGGRRTASPQRPRAGARRSRRSRSGALGSPALAPLPDVERLGCRSWPRRDAGTSPSAARCRGARTSASSAGRRPVGRSSPTIVPSAAIESNSNSKRSWSVITSDSIRCTSVTWVTRREPSSRRSRWITRSSADEICWRIALIGRSIPAISTIVSIRASASRGELAWTVVSEPSWPVFIACSMSSASAPRTSPTMMRSGRMRSELRTSSRIGISPSPSRFFGRDSRRRTWSWLSWSSAASSIVTTRSVFGIGGRERVQERRLAGARAAGDEHVQLGLDAGGEELEGLVGERAEAQQVVEHQALLRELADRQQRARERQRRDDHVDAAAVGQAGVDHRRGLVDAAADLRHHLGDDPAQLRLVVEAHRRLVEPALALDPDLVGAVDHDLRDRVVGEQPLERAVAEDVVGDLVARAARARRARCRPLRRGCA